MGAAKHTKADIVGALFEKTGMEREELRNIVGFVVEDIKDALINRKIVELRGFGTFEVKTRKAKQAARNPRTGETVAVDSHGSVVFKPGKELKQSVWNLEPAPDAQGQGAGE
jgi:integration host factor subunit beta